MCILNVTHIAPLKVAATTGRRITEVLRLTWMDIDWKALHMDLTRSVAESVVEAQTAASLRGAGKNSEAVAQSLHEDLSDPETETEQESPIFTEWRRLMRRTYRHWTPAEKRAAVEQMAVCGHGKIAAEPGISKRLLHTWGAHELRLEKAAKAETSKERALERENRQLKEALATKVLEADFLQRCVAQNRDGCPR